MPEIEQPDPVNKGEPVTEKLIQWLLDINADEEVINLIKERYEFGLNKYGQPLMSEDGRDTVQDAKEEVGDLLQYLFKAKMQGLELHSFKVYIPILEKLI